MHIHPSSPNSSTPSEENAAIKIQAGFRGYRVRKQLNHHQPRCSTNGYHSHRNTAHRRHQRQHEAMENHNGRRHSSSGNGNNASGQLRDQGDQNGDSNTIEDRCATKIQAGVRGFLVRKKQKIATDAATKIQASFRGFRVRKEAQKLKQK
ncbi:uncharacterized protein LOC119681414 [Teleopsis dalmanni]|uniref:uncharacterized protein LOC119681414 n=1 Tax=Teleopsis dalmanni TaxID=139649 RepID=UPI0018CFDBB2|nr:uncharacterized protein LOC119681414 [Teleopsis dalmanni]